MSYVKEGYSIKQAYTFYRKRYKKDTELVDRELYPKICKEFNLMIIEEALHKPLGVKLPYALGRIWIKKFKINWDKPPVDLNETRKQGKTIYHLNRETEGYCFRWAWSRKVNLMTNLIYYSFKPTKYASDTLAKFIKSTEHCNKKFFSNNIV